jgi:hypothetical protein
VIGIKEVAILHCPASSITHKSKCCLTLPNLSQDWFVQQIIG